jgi:DNA-binding NtrC family response regulator
MLFEPDKGRLEAANGGTLFLKHAESIPQELQGKLLQFVEHKTAERSRTTSLIDARLIATVTDTGNTIEDHWLYKGLLPRPSVIRVPPLRERGGDIPLIAEFFLRKWRRRANKSGESIPADTMSALVHYSWPENIRELESLIEHYVTSGEGPNLLLTIPKQKRPR